MNLAGFVILCILAIVAGFFAVRAHYWRRRARTYAGNIVRLSRDYSNMRSDQVRMLFTLGLLAGVALYFYCRNRGD